MKVPARFICGLAILVFSSVDVRSSAQTISNDASRTVAENSRSDETASLTEASWPEIASQIPKDSLVMVDFWSLSCAPCLKEFPSLVKISEHYGAKVQCISVNVDYDGRRRRPPLTYRDRAMAFLTSVQADKIIHYLCSTPSDEVLETIDAISIPAVVLYQDGKEIAKFVDAGQTSGFTYETDVQSTIEKCLSQTR